MTETRAELFGDDGTKWLMPPNSGENIPAAARLNKAKVTQGKWIFYNSPYEENGESRLVNEGDGVVDLGFDCVSAREAEYKSDGICLFEHYNYRGKMETFINSEAKLTGFSSGVSSGVIFPKSNWDLSTEESYLGLTITRSPGEYPTATDLGVTNDSIKSIRRG